MIRVPPQIAAIIVSLWGLAIGATTQISVPSWAHYVISAVGIILAGITGVAIDPTAADKGLTPPYPVGQQAPPAPTGAPAAPAKEQGLP